MDSSTEVTAELELLLVVPHDEMVVPLTAGLRYSKTDPYAVRLALHTGLDEPVEWVFARDLLSVGMEQEHGLGDVRVWPSVRSRGGLPGMVLNLELSSPNGQANFEMPLREIAGFLRRSHDLVPAGRESRYIDVDAELSALLRQPS